ncbi:MAG: GH92 family glycosyl hydrolase [Acidimicrobiales bacterium]
MKGDRRAVRRSALLVAMLALTGAAAASAPPPIGSLGGAEPPPVTALADPAALVHPLDGTGTGPVNPGTVGEFPGADTPFGMIQWSPDTAPDAVQSGGGYAYADSRINGFSLTHLSGTGCPSYQDVPILPTEGAIGSSPADTFASFSHAHEQATPGRYAVTLGPGPIDATLTVTARTGIGRFAFPSGTRSNVLFKVADSANPVSAASVRTIGDDEVEGQDTSGGFCQTGTNYTVYFFARFDRPFSSAGTWTSSGAAAGRTSCTGTSCGAFVTFDTTAQHDVLMKVGISFVSTRDAEQNLAAEDPGWSLAHVAARAHAQWNALLGRIAARGGTPAQEHTFYTALYHSLLFPNIVSDVNGQYAGSDGRVHSARGRDEYANFSDWDIYRSEIQLESLLDPHAVGDMVQSLVDDAQQTGWLPKWAIVAGDTSQVDGDSSDPIIADAYAMGVRNFDVSAALRAMVKGATQNETGHGLEIERQYLSQYLSQHYVNAASLDLTSIDYSIGGSVTLEYAIDDFAIARLASALGDHALASTMMGRAANWEFLFNPATGYMGARGSDGSFPPGPAFQTSQFEPGGQLGFEEGNAVQYTWYVPQDLAALASLMGGAAAASSKLTTFFTSLNASRYAPYDWSGNEPGEWAPWLFDYFGAPERTQGTVRAIVNDEYADAPVDEPGNDDLGAISSWYVWAALGLFPVTPGTANLALASPLFPSVTIALPDGRRIVEQAPGAAASRPYVHALSVSGVARPAPAPTAAGCPAPTPSGSSATGGTWDRPWLPSSVLRSGATLSYTLSSSPEPTWASALAASPPSFTQGELPAVGFSTPGGSITLTAGQATAVQIGVASAGGSPTSVRWQVAGEPVGLQVSPTSGTLRLGSASSHSAPSTACGLLVPATESFTVTGATPGASVLQVDLTTTGGVALPPVVLDVVIDP